MVDKGQEQIKRLIKRAKELQFEEEKNMLRRRMEGQLLKFTNVVKGYQYRWCVIDPETGTVEYYEKEEHKRSCKPRGVLNLTYASVCPSEEDSQAFVIHAANGDFLKLKAADAKERQFWVNRIRAVAEYYSEQAQNQPMLASLAQNSDLESSGSMVLPRTSDSHSLSQNSSLRARSPHTSGSNAPKPASSSTPARADNSTDCPSSSTSNGQSAIPVPADNPTNEVETFPVFVPGGSIEPRAQLRELFHRLDAESQALSNAVDAAAVHSPELTAVHKAIFLSKATSQATISCLKRCMDILKRGEPHSEEPGESVFFTSDAASAVAAGECGANGSRTSLEGPRMAGTTILRGIPIGTDNTSQGSGTLDPDTGWFPSPILNMNLDSISLPDFPGDAEPDTPLPESELGSVENQKHMILHLLSQVKLDMDLTKIVLPTFILEKRSLLEMFADYLAHPNLFIDITRGQSPESRMLAFVQWYLTSFHVGKKDKVAKKPYNPVIGESFHCCWLVQSDPGELIDTPTGTDHPDVITYCAEQVSHHPPVTAFHVSLPTRRMQLNSSVHTKSKFHGMSISVSMLGKTVLRLDEHNGEEYHFSFPTAYAHSILTVPWFELGGKVTVTCPQTGYSAVITFHPKPMRSNKLHRISAELFAPEDPAATVREPFAKVSGVWNGILEFELVRESKKWSLDVTALPIIAKRVRPIEKQRPEESRVLWHHVTNALLAGNLQLATEKKHELEERQRISEKHRARHRLSFPVKYFRWDGASWVFQPPGPESG